MKVATLSLLAMAVLLGCGATPAREQAPVPGGLDLAWSRLGAVQAGMVTTPLELESLMAEFDRLDEVYGGWLASQELCRYQAQRDDTAPACDDALRRARLSGRRCR